MFITNYLLAILFDLSISITYFSGTEMWNWRQKILCLEKYIENNWLESFWRYYRSTLTVKTAHNLSLKQYFKFSDTTSNFLLVKKKKST